jgi:hypothetical protein
MRSTVFIGALLFFAGAAVGAAWPRPARHEAATPASSSGELGRGELDDMELVRLRELAEGLSGDDAVALRQAIAKAIDDGQLHPRLAPGNHFMF